MVGMFRKAVREEAAPVARQLAEVRGLANQTNRRLELITSGWKSVEERLARIEAQLAAAPHLREVA